MTSRERVLRAIAHEETDRVPIDLYARTEVWEKLVEHLGTQDVLTALGVDFRWVGPRYIGPERPVPEGCDYVDEWGIGYRVVTDGRFSNDENVHLPWKDIETLEEVEAYPWPEPDQYDYSDIETQCDAIAGQGFAVGAGGWGTPDINNGTSFGRGMEQVMVDITVEDPVGVALIDKRLEVLYERFRRVLEAGKGKIDVFLLGEDCGSMTGPLYSPETYEEFFRPRMQRFYDLGHEFGCKLLQHSCGSWRELIPMFIDMGLDAIQGQPEPEGMDPAGLKRDFGDRITFVGFMSVQKTFPFSTEAECRQATRDLIDMMSQGGGYIFTPANALQPDTPVENIVAAYEEARRVVR